MWGRRNDSHQTNQGTEVTGERPDFGWWINSQGLEDTAVEVSLAYVGHVCSTN